MFSDLRPFNRISLQQRISRSSKRKRLEFFSVKMEVSLRIFGNCGFGFSFSSGFE